MASHKGLGCLLLLVVAIVAMVVNQMLIRALDPGGDEDIPVKQSIEQPIEQLPESRAGDFPPERTQDALATQPSGGDRNSTPSAASSEPELEAEPAATETSSRTADAAVVERAAEAIPEAIPTADLAEDEAEPKDTTAGTPDSESPAQPVQAPRAARAVTPAPRAENRPCNPQVEPACALRDLQSLRVASENRCSAYRRDDYPYSQSVEDRIIAGLGGVYGPYEGRWFGSKYDTDIEHIIAVSEAHDSGLCQAGSGTRARFSSDVLNLTLASPAVNRNQKRHHDAAGWLPRQNRCWFAGRVVAVRKKYRLTVDAAEKRALERVLRRCSTLRLQR